MKPKKNLDFIFLTILLVYMVYSGIYIYRTSFIQGGERYFVLFDDAMISMRYAKNFAEGHGLVWNPGEIPVEGYTNPLWVIYMALFHLFPIPASKMSLPIQISAAIFLILNLIFVKRIASSLTSNRVIPYLAVILTAFYMPINNWSLLGMEVSILILITTSAVWMVLVSLKKDLFSPLPYIILVIGTLFRLDMVVPYMVVFGFLLLFKPKWARQNLLWGLGLLSISLLGQTTLRLWYYGDALPNTYYLKMEGFPLIVRIKRGLLVLGNFIVQMNWALFLLPFALLVFKFETSTLFLVLIILGQAAYSVYVGGDAWEHQGGSNRYLSVVMPLFFILFLYSLQKTFAALSSYTRKAFLSSQAFINLCTVVVALLSLYNFNFFLKTSLRTIETWILKRQPIFVEANIDSVKMVQAIDQFTTPQARLAVVTAGAIPYFSERPSLDLLGKSDQFIAHEPNHLPSALDKIRPGHMKYNYDYAIGQLRPDVIVQLWGDDRAAFDYIAKYYRKIAINGYEFYALEGSQEILWEIFESSP